MEIVIGEYYYHKHLYQLFQVLAIDDNAVWLKSEDHYLTTMKSELVKEKPPIEGPKNSGV